MLGRSSGKVDKWFLIISAILVTLGFLIFSSASLGILATNQSEFSSIAFNQLFFGLFLGSLACLVFSNIDYQIWRKYAFIIFAFSIVATLLVFVPKLGFSHGGAVRWLNLGPLSFQPSELLKLGFI